VPTVRVATLLNAILDELSHLASCRPEVALPYDAPTWHHLRGRGISSRWCQVQENDAE
jgi:hypothetical protein